MNQLSFFESRLCKVGQGPKSSSWQENANDNDPEEVLIRNTYVNGLQQKIEKLETKTFTSGKKIQWADNNINNKSLLCNTSVGRELIFQKEIKPILTHKKLKPNKSCLKKSGMTMNSSSNYSTNSNVQTNMQPNFSTNIQSNYISNNNFNTSITSNFNYSSNSTSIPSQMLEIKKSNSFANSKDSTLNPNDKKYISPITNVSNITSVNFSENQNFKQISAQTSSGVTHSSSTELLKNYTSLGNIYNSQNSHEYVTNVKHNPKSFITPPSKESTLGKDLVITNAPSLNNLQSIYSVNNSSSGNTLSHLNITGTQNTAKPNLQTQTNPINSRQNNFTQNQVASTQQRSYSVGNDHNKLTNSYTGNNFQLGNNTMSQNGNQSNPTNQQQGETKIIIASKYKNVVHNSYNNIYIQNPEDLEKIYNNNLNSQLTNSNQGSTNYIDLPQNQSTANFNNYINKAPVPNLNNTNKLTKSGENQRMLQNNFLSPGINQSGTALNTPNLPSNSNLID